MLTKGIGINKAVQNLKCSFKMKFTLIKLFMVFHLGLVFSNPSNYPVIFDIPTTTDIDTHSTTSNSTELQCNIKGECNGSTLDYSIEPKSTDECLEFCKKSETAKDSFQWVTFSSERGLCKCYDTCENLKPNTTRDNCNDCISSEKDCEVVILECSKSGLCNVSFLGFISTFYFTFYFVSTGHFDS